jgi:hypothetical protein
MSVREKLLTMVENVKETLTSKQYQDLAEEIAKLDSGKIYKYTIIYADTTVSTGTCQSCECEVNTHYTVDTFVFDKVLLVKESDLEQPEILKRVVHRFENFNHCNVNMLYDLIPGWQRPLVQTFIVKRIAKEIQCTNQVVKLRIEEYNGDDIGEDDDEDDSDEYQDADE